MPQASRFSESPVVQGPDLSNAGQKYLPGSGAAWLADWIPQSGRRLAPNADADSAVGAPLLRCRWGRRQSPRSGSRPGGLFVVLPCKSSISLLHGAAGLRRPRKLGQTALLLPAARLPSGAVPVATTFRAWKRPSRLARHWPIGVGRRSWRSSELTNMLPKAVGCVKRTKTVQTLGAFHAPYRRRLPTASTRGPAGPSSRGFRLAETAVAAELRLRRRGPKTGRRATENGAVLPDRGPAGGDRGVSARAVGRNAVGQVRLPAGPCAPGNHRRPQGDPEYACAECHTLEPERWTVDGRVALRGMPRLDLAGNLQQEEDDNGTATYFLTLWEPAKLDGRVWPVGGPDVPFAARRLTATQPSWGGGLARLFTRGSWPMPGKRASGAEVEAGAAAAAAGGRGAAEPQWLFRFLLDPMPIRPAAVLRMPRFNLSRDEAAKLADYFAAAAGFTSPYTPSPLAEDEPIDWAGLDGAMRLVRDRTMFCGKCHLLDSDDVGQAGNLPQAGQVGNLPHAARNRTLLAPRLDRVAGRPARTSAVGWPTPNRCCPTRPCPRCSPRPARRWAKTFSGQQPRATRRRGRVAVAIRGIYETSIADGCPVGTISCPLFVPVVGYRFVGS